MENSLIGKSEIYMVTCNVTGKRYIGQVQCFYKSANRLRGAGVERRWKDHCYYASKNVQGRGARYLMNNIQKYGAHNHSIKTIFICPTSQANYWEIKYIRQFETQVPRGMNIMLGGKASPLAEETKQKLSESKKGKYIGDKNPMWGKNHSKETVDKIKRALTGKPLTQTCKENMSKSHQQNIIQGKLPPRRKHNNLPMYIYHVKSSNKQGYEIRHHPKLRQKQFTAKTLTLEQNLQRAIDYLADEENPKTQKQQQTYQEYRNLPRYIRHVRSEKFEGFEVKLHPTLQNKKWTNMKLSMEEKFKLAEKYLEEGSETRRLSVNANNPF